MIVITSSTPIKIKDLKLKSTVTNLRRGTAEDKREED